MKEQNTISVYLFSIFLMSSTPRPLCLYPRATKKRKITSHGDSQVVAFTSKKRARKLQSLAGARETRTLYKDNHNNRKNKNCSLTMCRSHNRPSSVVCICMHIQNRSTKLIMTSVVQELWSITLFRSVLFDKNMVNQARQCDQILENGPTRYIEQ